MEVENYIVQNKEIYTNLLKYFEDEQPVTTNDSNKSLIIQFNLINEREEIQELIQLISNVSSNHHRSPFFFDKLKKIISSISDKIKQNFTNQEIFNIFKTNKRVLLLLFETQIIQPDKNLFDYILNLKSDSNFYYDIYFYPEFKDFIDEETKRSIEEKANNIDPSIFTNFDEKRKIGENENKLCELIRTDSVEDFISYTTRNIIGVNSEINLSVFETNPFLIKAEKSTLIEYSAFFGAIQIFRYLMMNDVELTSSLWFYTIHSNNAELIHILEDNDVEPKEETDDDDYEDYEYESESESESEEENNDINIESNGSDHEYYEDDEGNKVGSSFSYKSCLQMAIKCHHNEIANYIIDNLMEVEKKKEKKFAFNKSIASYCFHYSNFFFYPTSLDDNYTFLYLCKYHYPYFVSLYLKEKNIDINFTIIKTQIFIFQIKFVIKKII